MLTAGREDEQVHKTAILEGLTAGVKSAFKMATGYCPTCSTMVMGMLRMLRNVKK